MSFTGGEGIPGRGKSTDKASAEVGKQEVRSQFDSGLGYGVQMAEAGAARAPWGLLGVGGRGGGGRAGGPGGGGGGGEGGEVGGAGCPGRGAGGGGGGAPAQGGAEAALPPPHPSPGTGSLGSAACAQEMVGLDYRED